jgi:hypothetical protein
VVYLSRLRLNWPPSQSSMNRHLTPIHDIARQVLTIAAYILVLALAAIATLNSATDPRRSKQAFGLWVTAMVLLTPGAWIHYMVLLLAPLALLAEAVAKARLPKPPQHAAWQVTDLLRFAGRFSNRAHTYRCGWKIR